MHCSFDRGWGTKSHACQSLAGRFRIPRNPDVCSCENRASFHPVNPHSQLHPSSCPPSQEPKSSSSSGKGSPDDGSKEWRQARGSNAGNPRYSTTYALFPWEKLLKYKFWLQNPSIHDLGQWYDPQLVVGNMVKTQKNHWQKQFPTRSQGPSARRNGAGIHGQERWSATASWRFWVFDLLVSGVSSRGPQYGSVSKPCTPGEHQNSW